MDQQQLINLLKTEIRSAVGCTEPVAVALGAAEAANILNDRIVRLTVSVDANIYKNGMGVYVPGTSHKGLIFAAALGAVAGKPELELEVLKNVTENDVASAERMIAEDKVQVGFLPGKRGIFVEVVAESSAAKSRVIIRDRHSNVVLKEKDGIALSTIHPTTKAHGEMLMNGVTLEELVSIVDGLDTKDLGFFETVIVHNRGIAEQGVNNNLGMGVGFKWKKLMEQKSVPNDWVNIAKAYTAGAIDARMSGKNLPVMSCAGSGNQGLMASLPIIVAADYYSVTGDKLRKALALSFAVTIHVKTHIGRLSALCGCTIAASAGVGAGLAYMLGLGGEGIRGVINNLVGNITGMICDGAKPGCSLKLMTAVDAACQMTLLAQEGIIIEAGSGIVADKAEDSIRNVGLLSNPGMVETDRTILGIMLQAQGK